MLNTKLAGQKAMRATPIVARSCPTNSRNRTQITQNAASAPTLATAMPLARNDRRVTSCTPRVRSGIRGKNAAVPLKPWPAVSSCG